jgi:hypothetical protein
MRGRPTKFNDTPTIEDAWVDEAEQFQFNTDDIELAVGAELAEELELFVIQAEEDENYYDKLEHWHLYLLEYGLGVALEQCCYEGALLPTGQLELRVNSCPREMLGHLTYFFSRCPAHVKHHLAMYYWTWVRLDRARRTGNPDWRPDKPPPREPYYDTVFFRPPILKFRNYAR